MRTWRPETRCLIALLLFAAALRAGMLWKYGENLAADVDDYRGIAENIVAGHGFANPDTTLPTAYRPPLYPLLLSVVLWAGGDSLAIGVLHLILGTSTVALTFFIGRRLSRGAGFQPARLAQVENLPHGNPSQALSLMAAALVAVDPLLLHNTTLVMTETLATFLAVLLLWWAARNGERTELRNDVVRWGLGLGLLFGLCCLCRPTFWAFGIVAVPPWLVGRARAIKGAIKGVRNLFRVNWPWDIEIRLRKRFLTPFIAPLTPRSATWPIALGIVIATAPWAMRNALVIGRPIVTTTHGGYTLLLGHNPVYYREVVQQPWGTVWSGDSLRAWQRSLDAAMLQETPPAADEIARDRWMNARAWQAIRDDPVMALRSGLTLLGRLWNILPLATESRSPPAAIRWGIGLFYTATFLVFLVGLVRLRRDEWPAWWPAAALIISFTLVHSLYWADMRMRAPLVPVIALLAARALRGASVP